jgi:ribosomal protein S3
MGQKINPIGLRLGINRTWDSRWFAGKNEYGKLLHEDVKIREVLHKELKQAAVARIVIERPHKKCRVTIHSARPGVVIGKKGADIDKLRKRVADITASDVVINIVEIRKPELDATLVAESIAQQLERRVAFRRAMKRAVQSAMRLGAEGIRINCSGALKSRGWSGTAKGACRCIRFARTSITGWRPRSPHSVPVASKSGSSKAKSLSTTRWPRTRKWLRATPRGRVATPLEAILRRFEGVSHDATKENEVPEGA